MRRRARARSSATGNLQLGNGSGMLERASVHPKLGITKKSNLLELEMDAFKWKG